MENSVLSSSGAATRRSSRLKRSPLGELNEMHEVHRPRRPRYMDEGSSCKTPADDHVRGLGPAKPGLADIKNDDIAVRHGIVPPDALQLTLPQPVDDEVVEISCKHECFSSNEAESIAVGSGNGDVCSSNGGNSIVPIKQVLYYNQDFQDVADLETGTVRSSDNRPIVEPPADVKRVFERFEDGSGQSRDRIVRVDRVQNDWLWTRYCKWRDEAKVVHEQYLWCGLNTVSLGDVVVRGFGALGLHRGPLFVANTALALHNAEEEEGQLQQMLVSAAAVEPTATAAVGLAALGDPAAATNPMEAPDLVPKLPDIQPGVVDVASNHSEAATAVAATESSLQGLLTRFKIPWFSSSGKHVEEASATATAVAPRVAAAAQTLSQAPVPQPPSLDQPLTQRPITNNTTATRTPLCVPSSDFPGKRGAVLLCRVVLSRMAIGVGDGHELPPDADSAMDMKMITASMEKRNATAALVAGEKSAMQSACEAAEDLAWSMRGAYADDLAVMLRCAAAQAYPEFIVHVD